MFLGAAALSLRSASEIIGYRIFPSHAYSYYPKKGLSIGETVSLHVCFLVYLVSTMVIGSGLVSLAEAFQRSTVSLAVDRYGLIRLPDYTI